MSGKDAMQLINGYPAYMRDSIEKVAATRAQRIKDGSPAPLSAEGREEVLRDWHPDYKADRKRDLAIGVSVGARMPHEVADVLEAYPLVGSDAIDLSSPDIEVQVLILGSGGAANVAALFAMEEGIAPDQILMASKLRHGDCNSIMAQGGIQAADRAVDSPAIHYLDVLGGGHYTNKPELVRALVSDGPMIIDWHEKLGALYDKVDGEYLEVARDRVAAALAEGD